MRQVDTGCAATFLPRFAQAPAEERCEALKGTAKCLQRAKDWGIARWREQPAEPLPNAPLLEVNVGTSLPALPAQEPLCLVRCLGAACATDLKACCSITGCAFTPAGGAIAFKLKLQPVVTTSSAEAEFVASVSAAKVAKHLCSTLSELGCAQAKPAPLHVGNQAAIAMVNKQKPAPHCQHADIIQCFATQEQRVAGDIEAHHAPDAINPSNQAAKALGWALHSRRAQ